MALVFERLDAVHPNGFHSMKVFRAKVVGGWIVVLGTDETGFFFPDPTHEWDGSSLP